MRKRTPETNIRHSNQFQACPNLVHTRSWDPYLCNKEESCNFLFEHIVFWMPEKSFESWDLVQKLVCMVCMVWLRFGQPELWPLMDVRDAKGLILLPTGGDPIWNQLFRLALHSDFSPGNFSRASWLSERTNPRPKSSRVWILVIFSSVHFFCKKVFQII